MNNKTEKEIYKLTEPKEMCPKCNKGRLLYDVGDPSIKTCSWTMHCDYINNNEEKKEVIQLKLF